MDKGIKIAKQKKDGKRTVKTSDIKSAPSKKVTEVPHILYAVALPYYDGAITQLGRYEQATLELKLNPVSAVQVCLHEVSCLFEDLATVSKYAEMCGHTNQQHSLWLDVRNHIRHDIREEFNNESDGRKNARAKRLGLHPDLQIGISFKPESITVGSTLITIASIQNYLEWAGSVIGPILENAKAKGLIK